MTKTIAEINEKIKKGDVVVVTAEEISYIYEGRRYYFCCPMCIEEFKKDSEKYIKKMEEAKTAEKECMD